MLLEKEAKEIQRQILELMEVKEITNEVKNRFLKLATKSIDVCLEVSDFCFHFDRRSKRFKTISDIHIKTIRENEEYDKFYGEVIKYSNENPRPVESHKDYNDDTVFDFN
jgi:hypothetical protein